MLRCLLAAAADMAYNMNKTDIETRLWGGRVPMIGLLMVLACGDREPDVYLRYFLQYEEDIRSQRCWKRHWWSFTRSEREWSNYFPHWVREGRIGFKTPSSRRTPSCVYNVRHSLGGRAAKFSPWDIASQLCHFLHSRTCRITIWLRRKIKYFLLLKLWQVRMLQFAINRRKNGFILANDMDIVIFRCHRKVTWKGSLSIL